MTKEPTDKATPFARKVWIATGIVALTVIIIWIVKVTFNVLLLILAGALIALYFRGLSGFLQRKLRLKKKWGLPVAIVITVLLLAGFIALAGNRISQQVNELSQTLPATIDKVREELNKVPMAQQAMQKLSSGGGLQKVGSVVQSFFRSTFGVLGDIYIVLFLGIFFTAGPKVYVDGFLKLIPAGARPMGDNIISKLGLTLTKWLKGKLFAMLVVTLLTLIGLLIIGMPMAFVLSLIAGLLNFIPNFGPIIALVPAVLVALMESPTTAAMVAGLYILVQVLESNVITPQIQKRLVSIPPALIIIAQLFMGVLTGGWGIVLATPVVLILIVIINETYVKKQPGNE